MIKFHENGKTIAEITGDNPVISEVQDMLDLMGLRCQDFIRESNKGNRIFFVNDFEEALKKLRGL